MLLMRSTLFLFMMVSVSSMIPNFIRRIWKRPAIISSPQPLMSKILEEASLKRTILESIDHSINPCEDFYHHACGNRLSRDKMGLAQRSQNIMEEEIKLFVEQNRISRAFVNSCMKQNELKPTVTEFILQKIKEIEDAKDVSKIMSIVGVIGKETGVTPFIQDLTLVPEVIDAKLTYLLNFDVGVEISTQSMTIALENMKNDNILTDKEIKAVLEAIRQYHLSKETEEMLTKQQRRVHEDAASGDSKSSSNFNTASEIVARYSTTFGPLIKETFGGSRKLEELLLSKEMIYKSFDSMERFLKKANLPTIIKVAKYAIATSVASLYFKNGYSMPTDELKEVCQKRAAHYFQDLILNGINRHYRDPDTVRSVRLLWNDILKEANLKLKDKTLKLAEHSRKEFAERINSIQLIIEGEKYDENQEQQRIQKHFKNLMLDGDNPFFINLMMLNREYLNIIISKIGRKQNLSFLNTTSNVSGIFFKDFNVVVLSNFLRFPMIGPGSPSIYRYAIIGDALSKALMRPITSCGIHYNKLGTRVNTLCSSSSRQRDEHLDNQEQCYDNFYSQLHTNPSNTHFLAYIDGEIVLDEYITNSGLELAYNAFMKKGDTSEYSGYSPEKLFFLSYAQRYCSSKPSNLDIEATINSFVFPPEIIVNGNLMQNNDFAKAFKCSANSRMNPQTKCNLWGKPESPSKL